MEKRKVVDDLKLFGVAYVYEGKVLHPAKMIVYRRETTDLNERAELREVKFTEADFGVA